MNPVNPFPAVLIGGPPHSGKSVLVHVLTLALRDRQIDHYVLRATPDGEGDWANVAEQSLVQTLRRKGKFNPEFVSSTVSYLQNRQIPLLVDVGGRPTADQQALFSLCTHAILLVGERADEPGRYEQDMDEWQAMMTRQHVPVIAVLRSVLEGASAVTSADSPITGTISGLERGRTVSNELVELLVTRLTAVLTGSGIDIATHHQDIAPDGLFVHLPRALQTLRPNATEWLPSDLAALRTLIPAGVALAVYGRAPTWAYVQMALHTGEEPVWFFNTRVGWMTLPHLPIVRELHEDVQERQPGWFVIQHQKADYTVLTFTATGQNLDPQQPHLLPFPDPQPSVGLILSGKMPQWLMAAAAKQLFPGLPQRPYLAIYQPHLNGAVVVASNHPDYPIGHVVASE